MAQKIVTLRISDISGEDLGDGGQTIDFAVGSTSYRIDLSDKEVENFFNVLKPYVDNAQKVGGRGVRRSGASTKTDAAQLKQIRSWAKENGYNPSDRGRVSQEIKDAYEAAH